MTSPNYYAYIPSAVRYDKRLSPNVKLMYGEITALANTKGYCFASNKYFSDLYDVSTYTVSRWVSQLESAGYIETQIIYDGKQIKERRIYLSEAQYLLTKSARGIDEKRNTPIDEKRNTPIDEKRKDNNTSIFNNTSMNNIDNSYSAPCENEPLFAPELEVKFMEWIRYKKEQHRFSYRPVAMRSLRSQINRHLENYTPEQIIEIIDLSIASGYKGILFDRLDKPQQNKQKVVSYSEMARRLEEQGE